MTYSPADVPGFTGLDLADVEDAKGAIEATDCYVDPDGTLVPRKGYTKYGTGTIAALPTASIALAATTVPIRNLVPNPTFDSPTGWVGSETTVTTVTYPSGTLKATNGSGGVNSIVVRQATPMEVSASTNYVGGFKTGTITATGGVSCQINWYAGTTLLYPDVAKINLVQNTTYTFSITSWEGANRAVISFFAGGSSPTAADTYITIDDLWLTTADYTAGTFFSAPIVSQADRFVVGYSTGTGANGSLKSYSTSGSLIAQTGTITAGSWSLAALNGFVYAAGSGGLYRVTKDAISQPTCGTRMLTEQVGVFTSGRAMPKPQFVGRQTPDNRLVAAGFDAGSNGPNGTETTPATVFFSQPDQPEKWDETEFEVVGAANDPIIGLANWGDYLLVFKAQEWYVFYGNSVRSDGTGLAIFNYRKVEAGCNVVSHVAGSRSLYVMDSDGNLRATTGGAPQIIFNGDTSKYSPVSGQGFRAGRFIGFPVTGGYLVLDEDNNSVFFWTLPLKAGATWGDKALFPHPTSGIGKFPEGTTDNGTAITASYKSPYSSWGQAGVEKSVRQTMFHGTGSLSVAWGKNLQAHTFPRAVLMRDGRGIDRNAVRGETLSYKLSGSSFTLNRLVPMLREQRPGGVRA